MGSLHFVRSDLAVYSFSSELPWLLNIFYWNPPSVDGRGEKDIDFVYCGKLIKKEEKELH